jgi:hypothetical protein
MASECEYGPQDDLSKNIRSCVHSFKYDHALVRPESVKKYENYSCNDVIGDENEFSYEKNPAIESNYEKINHTRKNAFVRPESVNDLSPEVFQLIIAKYLKSNNWRKLIPLRTVSSYWKLNIDSYLSSRHGFRYCGVVTREVPNPPINYKELSSMLAFYPNMRQLIVKNFKITDHLIVIIKDNCPKVERLSLYGCKGLTWKGTAILVKRFPQLTFLDVSHCDLDEQSLQLIVQNLPRLRILNAINPGHNITGECLKLIGPEIEDIWIGLNHLSNPNETLKALISGNGRRLLHFGLIVQNYQKINWRLIADAMPQLKSLKLTFGSYGYGELF